VDRPTIRILEPGDEEALEAFLLPRIETSMFLVGNMRTAGLRDEGQRYGGTYAAAFEEGRIVGVVAHYWNGNLVFQAPAHLHSLWRLAASASRRGIQGLIGPSVQVDPVKAALHLDEAVVQMDETENLYSLRLDDLLVPETLRSGLVRTRRAEPKDVELLTAWSVAYSVEALTEEDTPALRRQVRSRTERSVAEGETWLLEAEGRSVACSSFNTAFREAVQVGGVYTPPELRDRGYGRAVVAASLLDARAEGVGTGILFTGVNNLAAQKAYAALGFRHIGDYRLVLLRSPVEVDQKATSCDGREDTG
jgi:predicted GNAT family acetyltransferase